MRTHGPAAKSVTAFRTISEVSAELDVPQHVLRFWESRFPQLRPLKRGGGRRYYRPEDVDLLRQIQSLLYSEGYTIKGVQRLLTEGVVEPAQLLDRRVPDESAGAQELATPGADQPQAPAVPLDTQEAATPVVSSGLPETARQAIADILEELKSARSMLVKGVGSVE